MRKILSKFYKKIGRDNRGESCSDHIHMLARIPPTYSVSEIIWYIKGKSLFIIFNRSTNLKYKYCNGNFLV